MLTDEERRKRNAEANRQYYIRHKERVAKRCREYYLKNREKINAYRRSWNKSHRATPAQRRQRTDYQREYYLKNRDRINARRRELYFADCDRLADEQRARYARLKAEAKYREVGVKLEQWRKARHYTQVEGRRRCGRRRRPSACMSGA